LRGATPSWLRNNARVARRFPHTPERPRDGRRCHTSAGEEVIPAPALRRSVPTKRIMRELLVALTSAPTRRRGDRLHPGLKLLAPRPDPDRARGRARLCSLVCVPPGRAVLEVRGSLFVEFPYPLCVFFLTYDFK
jgi:hypothetical protein